MFLAKDNKKIRLFISVELSPLVRKEIERFLKKVKRSWFPVRWVLPKNIHITLAFLGWQQKKFEVKTVELIRDCIKKAIEGIESLEVKIRDIGCFPNERRPRVIWLGLAGELKSLALLHKQVNQELKKVGFTLEERKFIPHLTLGRVERKIGVGALRNLGDQVSRMKVEEFRSKILVEKVSLMESRLRREGSEYRELTSVKLKMKNQKPKTHLNIKLFSSKELNWLYRPKDRSVKEDNGQLTIIGGSSLFHGAPILALKTASRIVDMVFFASPEPSLGRVAEKIKSQLASFIWVPLGEVEEYIKKSDAVLIGPGLMRFRNEKDKKKAHLVCDEACQESKQLTESLVKRFSKKQWVIDGGSLQTMGSEFISKGAILTPNQKEFRMLFSAKDTSGVEESVRRMARKYNCIIVLKGPTTIVCSPDECVLVKGGNAGLTKGGSGDVLAGLTVALAAKNEPLLAACAASWIVKKAADELYKKVGFAYNADDLAEKVPGVLGKFFTCQ